jgi:hypothetical protein
VESTDAAPSDQNDHAAIRNRSFKEPLMKRSVITLFAATALVVAGIGVTSAIAMPSHAAAPKLLRVVMRDPGCHWFAVAGKYTTSATVSSPIRLLNLDMAALDATSNGAVKRIPVGHSLLLGRGHYDITMVGQAPDDNHLKLNVR